MLPYGHFAVKIAVSLYQKYLAYSNIKFDISI
jgi:hypothetical protein